MSNELVPTQVEADQTTISSILAMMQEFQDHVRTITGCNVKVEVGFYSNYAEHAHWFAAAETMDGVKVTNRGDARWAVLGPDWNNRLVVYGYIPRGEAAR